MTVILEEHTGTGIEWHVCLSGAPMPALKARRDEILRGTSDALVQYHSQQIARTAIHMTFRKGNDQ